MWCGTNRETLLNADSSLIRSGSGRSVTGIPRFHAREGNHRLGFYLEISDLRPLHLGAAGTVTMGSLRC
jgi:hypothetical protein